MPVAADPGGQVSGLGLFGGQGADGVDDLAAPAALTVDRRADAGDLDGLGGVREPEPGRDGDRLDGAVLDPAVAVAGVDVADRDVLPGQRFSVACRVGWLPFTVTSRCAPRAYRNSAWLVWACSASTVTSTSVRSSTWSSRSLNRATSLVLASTSTWATTTPRPCSTAASRCTGRLPRPRALRVARSALPSTASTSRGLHRPGTTGVVLASTDRSHAPSACCNPAASTRVRTRQNVTGSGTAPVRPSCERCWAGRSTAQSATAANERAPAMTAHTATARRTANGYLTPLRCPRIGGLREGLHQQHPITACDRDRKAARRGDCRGNLAHRGADARR